MNRSESFELKLPMLVLTWLNTKFLDKIAYRSIAEPIIKNIMQKNSEVWHLSAIYKDLVKIINDWWCQWNTWPVKHTQKENLQNTSLLLVVVLIHCHFRFSIKVFLFISFILTSCNSPPDCGCICGISTINLAPSLLQRYLKAKPAPRPIDISEGQKVWS